MFETEIRETKARISSVEGRLRWSGRWQKAIPFGIFMAGTMIFVSHLGQNTMSMGVWVFCLVGLVISMLINGRALQSFRDTLSLERTTLALYTEINFLKKS